MQGQRTEVAERPAEAARAHDGRSLGALILELTRETSALVRAEGTLARLEIEEKLSQMQRAAAGVASGALVTFAGACTLIACAVLALSLAWPAWAAALCVGVVVTAIGAVLLSYGRKRMKGEALEPRRTMASLRDTKDFTKEQVS